MSASGALQQGWRMLLESTIDHEYPLAMKMEIEAPMASNPFSLPAPHCWPAGSRALLCRPAAD